MKDSRDVKSLNETGSAVASRRRAKSQASAKARAGAESALRRAEEDWLEASAEFDQAAG